MTWRHGLPLVRIVLIYAIGQHTWQVTPDQGIQFSWKTGFLFRFHPVVLEVANFLPHSRCISFWCKHSYLCIAGGPRLDGVNVCMVGPAARLACCTTHENTKFHNSWSFATRKSRLFADTHRPTFTHMTRRDGLPRVGEWYYRPSGNHVARAAGIMRLVDKVYLSDSNTLGWRKKRGKWSRPNVYDFLETWFFRFHPVGCVDINVLLHISCIP